MKCKLLMVMALLLLSFNVSQAADSVAIAIYDVANAVVLDPTVDSIITQDPAGDPLQYQMWISIESDSNLSSITLGFRLWSDDGVSWQYDAQVDGYGPGGPNTGLEAITVVAGSRLDPVSESFDLGGLLVKEQDVDGAVDDSIMVGGVGYLKTLGLGPMEPMLALHFTPDPVGFGEVKTMCFDSAYIAPGGSFIFIWEDGTPSPPGFAPAVCFPVITHYDPSDADDDSPAVPYTYDMGQNYPNPFNPTTVLKYSVPRKTHVDISVYNILGQHVATLVNGEVDAGPHEVEWDGNDDNGDHVASGIYFYKMYSGDYIQTRKMVLMR